MQVGTIELSTVCSAVPDMLETSDSCVIAPAEKPNFCRAPGDELTT